VPIWLGTFFQQLYSTADAIILGRLVGIDALAAVGATSTLVNLLVGFFTGLASGATVLIAQYYGGGNHRQVNRGVHTAFALSLVGGLFIMVVGIAISRWALMAMDTPEDILETAVAYIRTYFLGMIPTLIYNMGTGILRALGDSKRPLYFLIVASFLNIGLDFLLIAGFKLGVVGAALATVLAQAVSAGLVLRTLICADGMSWQYSIRQTRFHGDLLREILRIGLPAGVQSILYTSSNIMIQTAVNSFGTNTVAAWTVYGKLDFIFWMSINSLGLAMTTFAGQNFGAQKYDRVKRSTWVALGLGAVMTVTICVGMLAFISPLYRLFTSEAEVIAIGTQMMRFLVPTYITYLSIEVFSGMLRGVGDALTSTIMTCFGTCILRVVWLLVVVPGHHTLEAVMVIYPITWTVTTAMYFIYYFSGVWLRKAMRHHLLSFEKESRQRKLP
jgi:putative MATE family efflux protein